MATQIKKKSAFMGINAVGKNFKLCQPADDTAIFLKDLNQIVEAVACINAFSDVSGLKINLDKSVLFPIKSCNLSSCYGIPIKEKVTYLGVVICNDAEQ